MTHPPKQTEPFWESGECKLNIDRQGGLHVDGDCAGKEITPLDQANTRRIRRALEEKPKTPKVK